jgi:C1A family cysteine protease
MKKYFVPLFFVLLSCGEHLFDDMLNNVLENAFGTGLMPADNPDIIPKDIKSFSDDASLPASVSLEDKFPPIQSQGQFGTCAVWSTGYAFKTALNAIEKNWSSADLAKSSNQTSPKDLWVIIPNKRNSNCNGVAMEYAMDALIADGAASMADVPYNMGGSCDASVSTAKGDPNNKLANYRKIAVNEKLPYKNGSKVEGMDVDNFKSYLAQGRPIAFAAPLGNRFRSWNSSSVLSSDYGASFGHAMVLVGYDDAKGAFRVRNSWGTDWGDNGSIWVDYDYFVKDFCAYAFVAQNPNFNPDNDKNPPIPNTYDLLASFAEDYHDPEDKTGNLRKRAFSYQVYNNGSNKILASQNWGVYYMYYNAYDANDDYEIIFEDHYTDEYGEPCTKPGDFDKKVCYGEYDSYAVAGGLWNNMDIAPGKKAGEAETGGEDMEIPYIMPNINGDYYLVVYADYEDVIKESNEDNNFYFITSAGGKPLKFENGVMQSTPINSTVLAKRSKPAPVHSVVDLGELNGYTPKEIKTLLTRDKKNGVFAKKVAQYRKNAHPVKRIKRQ